jgi:hypothetical protein
VRAVMESATLLHGGKGQVEGGGGCGGDQEDVDVDNLGCLLHQVMDDEPPGNAHARGCAAAVERLDRSGVASAGSTHCSGEVSLWVDQFAPQRYGLM